MKLEINYKKHLLSSFIHDSRSFFKKIAKKKCVVVIEFFLYLDIHIYVLTTMNFGLLTFVVMNLPYV